jgi:hypothetical protein
LWCRRESVWIAGMHCVVPVVNHTVGAFFKDSSRVIYTQIKIVTILRILKNAPIVDFHHYCVVEKKLK